VISCARSCYIWSPPGRCSGGGTIARPGSRAGSVPLNSPINP
jgi:hypothetical protein